MASGYKDFTSGSTLAAADLEDYCELQAVMRFNDAATRATALSSVKTEGMATYLIDTNTLSFHVTGTTWSTVGPISGALTAWSPTLTQSSAVTKTVTHGAYTRLGRWVSAYCTLAVTGSGTSSNAISVSLPVTAATSTATVGTGYLVDASANAGSGGFWPGVAVLASSTTAVLYATSSSGNTAGSLLIGSGANTFSSALASGDTVAFRLAYEASADA